MEQFGKHGEFTIIAARKHLTDEKPSEPKLSLNFPQEKLDEPIILFNPYPL
jgi:hypothetical protein